MLYNEILAELKAGQYVTRQAWTDGSYLALLPKMQYIWKVQVTPSVGAGNWLGMFEDYQADDWKLLSDVVEEVAVTECAAVADDLAA